MRIPLPTGPTCVNPRHERACKDFSAPGKALVRDGEDWRVWVMHQGRAQARKVVLKDRNAELGSIAPGSLQAGDSVVLYPAALREGQRLQLAP